MRERISICAGRLFAGAARRGGGRQRRVQAGKSSSTAVRSGQASSGVRAGEAGFAALRARPKGRGLQACQAASSAVRARQGMRTGDNLRAGLRKTTSDRRLHTSCRVCSAIAFAERIRREILNIRISNHACHDFAVGNGAIAEFAAAGAAKGARASDR